MNIKHILFFLPLFVLVIQGNCQSAPGNADPCMKLDTGKIKQMLLGTWVDVKDSTHTLVIIPDSVEETIVIPKGIDKEVNVSYWNYYFTDNLYTTDAVTCYSLVETMADNPHASKYPINAIYPNYLLLGGEGEFVYRRKK